jgi:starch synthase
LSYQGEFPKATFKKTGLPESIEKNGIFQKNKFNFLSSGLHYADYINTVSETYAVEICKNADYTGGLQTVLKKRKSKVAGIANGIDTLIWNPEKDKKIEKKYSIKSLDDKRINKRALSEKFGFDYNEEIPLIGMISRLEDEKGFDLVQKGFKELMKLNIRLVLLGTGNRKYHKFFQEAASKYRKKFSCYLGFDDELAHLIEAGADMFLMPSKHEPCGLNQMYSLVYGTIPIVRETGGLADTVARFNEKDGTGNGFSFKKYEVADMMKEIKRALKIYNRDKSVWQKIMKTGMKSNFTWMNSSKNYVDLYKKIISS